MKFYVETEYKKGVLLSVDDAQALMGILDRADSVTAEGYGDDLTFTRKQEPTINKFVGIIDPKIMEPAPPFAPVEAPAAQAPAANIHEAAY